MLSVATVTFYNHQFTLTLTINSPSSIAPPLAALPNHSNHSQAVLPTRPPSPHAPHGPRKLLVISGSSEFTEAVGLKALEVMEETCPVEHRGAQGEHGSRGPTAPHCGGVAGYSWAMAKNLDGGTGSFDGGNVDVLIDNLGGIQLARRAGKSHACR